MSEVMTIPAKVATESKHINLKVLGMDDSVVLFKIKKQSPLRKLMYEYCRRLGLSMEFLRFKFDGVSIRESNTPEFFGMVEGDTIEVYQEQTGGMEVYLYLLN